MNILTILIGIVMFAIVTAFIYAWGLRNDVTKEENLERLLLSKSAGKVTKYLKKNGTATKEDICAQIKKVSGGFFWSKQKIKVSDPVKFSNVLIDYMIRQQLIQPVGKNNYKLKNK